MKRFLKKRIDAQSSTVFRGFKIFRVSLMMLFVFTSQMYAASDGSITPQQEITGTVTDANNSPLPGVNVLVVGTTTGTETDFDGNYTINVNKGDVLQFSFVGMQTQTITVGDNNTINITLAEDANALDEVVVVGYGSQRKNDITGAVSSISADDIVSVPTTNAEQALQGKATGVTIVNTGSPGTSPIVRIRGIGTYGDNTPIFVVDGVITKNISDLSAADIESMSVLKDASTTAVYGSLGANGVIVIKTKNGRNGDVQFSFSTYMGSQSKPKTLDLLNSAQYVEYATEMQVNAAQGVPARFADTQFVSNNTNWQKEIYNSGTLNTYQLSASGGNENSKFRISGGYQTKEGVLLNTNFDKYTARLNSEFKKGKFTFGESLSVAFLKQNPQINGNALSPFENAIKMAPYLPVHDTGNLGGFKGPDDADGQDARNPVRVLTQESIDDKTTSILGNVFGTYSILDGLDYTIDLGINYSNTTSKRVSLPYFDGEKHALKETSVSQNNWNNLNITIRNSLRYTKTFNDNHNLELLALTEKIKGDFSLFSANGITSFGSQELPANSSARTQLTETTRIGYLGRVNYNYAGKYILAASVRRDASSRFGPNNRWGTFSSVAAGWVISKEDFFGEDSAMNYFKIRGSWGQAGNDQSGGYYTYESTLTDGFNYGNNIGLAVLSSPNPDLKWEETITTNLGVDLGFLNNKITISAEYYNNSSDDLIVSLPRAASAGLLAGTPTNVGAMTTKGFEFNLGFNDREGDFTWSTNFNLSTTKNIVDKLADNVEQLFGGARSNVLGGASISRLVEGESMWHFYGWQTDGIFQSQAEIDAAATQENAAPGDIRFKDINGDNVIDADDKTIIGNPFPKLTYGLSLDAGYKGFDFSMLFSGVSGNEIFNANRFYLDGADRIFNAGTAVLDRWTPTNPSTAQPRAITGDPNKNTRVSDRYVEDGSFLRLRNISLGYNISENSLKGFAGGVISKFRIYVSAQNVFTSTNYSGLDPELAPLHAYDSPNIELGVDRGQYPQTTSVLAGLQITF